MMNGIFRWLVLSLWLLAAPGCGTLGPTREFSFHAGNLGKGGVDNIVLRGPGFELRMGGIDPNVPVYMGPYDSNRPLHVAVEWTTRLTNKVVRKDVTFAPPGPGKREEILVLVFFDDDVVARVLYSTKKWDDKLKSYVSDYGPDVEARRAGTRP